MTEEERQRITDPIYNERDETVRRSWGADQREAAEKKRRQRERVTEPKRKK